MKHQRGLAYFRLCSSKNTLIKVQPKTKRQIENNVAVYIKFIVFRSFSFSIKVLCTRWVLFSPYSVQL